MQILQGHTVGGRDRPSPHRPSFPGPGEHARPPPWHGLMAVWQPDCHRDRLDEFVFVDISMRPRGPSAPARWVPAATASPRPAPHPSPAFVNISKCQAKSPSMRTSANPQESLLFSPPYLFFLALPPPSSHSSEKKRLQRQRRPGRDEQSRPRSVRAEGGICRRETWPGRGRRNRGA